MYNITNTSTNRGIYPIMEHCKQDVSTRNIVFAVVISIIVVIAIIGNILTIAVILYSRHLRSQTTYHFVLSLATADLFVSILLTSLKVDRYSHNGNFCHNRSMCFARQFFDVFFMATSITHLFVISVDRFIAIRLPYFHAAKITNSTANIVIIGIWLYSAIWASLGMFRWDSQAIVNAIHVGWTLRECISDNKYFITVVGSVVYFIPTAIMTGLYIIILFIAQKQANAIESLKPSNLKSNKRRFRKDMRALKTVLLVSSAYVICWLPNFVVIFLFYWSRQTLVNFFLADPSPGGAFDVVTTIANNILPVLNSCLNPFIYFLSSAHFRTAFKDMVYKVLKKPRQGIIYPDETTINTRFRTSTAINTFSGNTATIHSEA